VKSLHNLLLRQLRRLGLETEQAPDAAVWREFLVKVSRSYGDADQERYLSQRSLEISSAEMQELYEALEKERDTLGRRVKEHTAELQKSERRFRSLTSLSSDWFWEQDAELRFTSISGHFCESTGISEEDHIGKARWELPRVEPPPEGWAAHRVRLAARMTFHDLQLRRRLPDGSYSYSSVSGEPVFGDNGKFLGYRGIGRDITQQKMAEEKLTRLARFDTLTGLLNRSTFFDCFDHALAMADRDSHQFAVLFIDLDRFKDLNDTLGHIVGDEVLKVMAQRLQKAVRSADTLARLGGDEFVLLAENAESTQSVADLAQRVVETLAEPLLVRGEECRLGASVGVAMYPADGEDAPTLLRNADIAMYHAKASRRNGFAFFSEALDKPQKERMLLGASLHRALELNQLLLLYQPKVSVATGAMVGVEALIRWQHPERGLVLPGVFIPLAEESGLILPFGRWVLRSACSQAMAWQALGLPPFSVAINLSGRQFTDPQLAADIRAALSETGLDPRLLELEITESVIVDQHERALETLRQVKAMGVQVSIDDFGTGYSSLARLQKFPIDALKIDGSFIGAIAVDADGAAITTAIIAMAHSLRLRVVAEGVETREQAQFLRQHRCDEMQGYYFSQPVLPAEIVAFAHRAARTHLGIVSAMR
jgi:diguanylate cyclase (GGDEF)-like protein/PAS domain S-box-containing protein